MNKRLITAALTLVTAAAGCMASTLVDPCVDWVVADEQRFLCSDD